MYKNSRKTGLSEFFGPASNNVKWSIKLGARTDAGAVISKDEKVIVPCHGKVSCVDTEDGRTIWEFAKDASSPNTAMVFPDGGIHISAGTKAFAIISS